MLHVESNRDYIFLLLFSHVQLFCDSMDCGPQSPLSLEFPRQEYWSWLPFPPPGDLPDPGIELGSPAWQADSLPLSHSEAQPSSYYSVNVEMP